MSSKMKTDILVRDILTNQERQYICSKGMILNKKDIVIPYDIDHSDMILDEGVFMSKYAISPIHDKSCNHNLKSQYFTIKPFQINQHRLDNMVFELHKGLFEESKDSDNIKLVFSFTVFKEVNNTLNMIFDMVNITNKSVYQQKKENNFDGE